MRCVCMCVHSSVFVAREEVFALCALARTSCAMIVAASVYCKSCVRLGAARFGFTLSYLCHLKLQRIYEYHGSESDSIIKNKIK